MLTRKKIESTRQGEMSIASSLLLTAAKKLGLEVEVYNDDILKIHHGDHEQMFQNTFLPGVDIVASRVASNKLFVEEFFRKNSIHTPESMFLTQRDQWRKVLDSDLEFPLVVKPNKASHGHGGTVNLTTEQELKSAINRAFDYNKRTKRGNGKVLIQEYFPGEELRFFVIGDRVMAIAEREPASVTGNNVDTVEEIIQKHNQEWEKRPGEIYGLPVCEIPIDMETRRVLQLSGNDYSTILPLGKKVFIRCNSNVSTGGRAIDVTNRIGPKRKAIAIKCAELLGVEIAGVDAIVKDIDNDDVDDFVVLEVNSTPGFDIHVFPWEGESRDVAEDILRHVFSQELATT
ncbi:hypothetical protein ACFL2D_02670 [Patescibacteria group bacterium]